MVRSMGSGAWWPELESCDLAYVTLLLCGSVSPLQNGDLNHKCITGLEVGQLSR